MANTQQRYPEEFKKKLVALVREGRTPEELSRQFEPSAAAWFAQETKAAPNGSSDS
jgi:transposase